MIQFTHKALQLIDANKAFILTLNSLKNYGHSINGTIELNDFSVLLDPTQCRISIPERNFKTEYAIKEFLWYLGTNKDVTEIGKLAHIWNLIKDEQNQVESNYGEYLFLPITGQQLSQFEWVIRELSTNQASRRAIININQPYHKFKNEKDHPCTVALGFNIEDNRFNMRVLMRSNDVYFGFSNDIFTFSLIHQLFYNELKIHLPDITLGYYYHYAASMHIYERHYAKMEEICNKYNSAFIPEDTTLKLIPEITYQTFLNADFKNKSLSSRFYNWKDAILFK